MEKSAFFYLFTFGAEMSLRTNLVPRVFREDDPGDETRFVFRRDKKKNVDYRDGSQGRVPVN